MVVFRYMSKEEDILGMKKEKIAMGDGRGGSRGLGRG